VASGERAGECLDLNCGAGPEVVLWRCHSPTDTDYENQLFTLVDGSLRAGDRCLSALNAAPQPDNLPSPLGHGVFEARAAAMLRLLKAAGVNGVALSNVNACGGNAALLSTLVLLNISRNLAPIFTRNSITPYLTVCQPSS
jgi:hypothetical protein